MFAMKITLEEPETNFIPYDIVIRVETRQEQDALYCLGKESRLVSDAAASHLRLEKENVRAGTRVFCDTLQVVIAEKYPPRHEN